MVMIPENRKTQFYLEDLADCIDRKEFVLFFQPIYEASTQAFIGFEVLARLHHIGHIYTPNYFLEQISQHPHLNKKFTLDILQQAISFSSTYSCYLHINLDATQLFNPDAIKLLKTSIQPNSHICVEIVETHKIQDIEKAQQVLQELKSHGIKIALDDFGVGYNNLSYLSHLPIDIVKIDKQFLLTKTKKTKTLFNHIIKLSHDLDLTVIVEGVETQEHYDYCKELGVYGIQGYFLGRPMEQTQAVALLTMAT